MFFKKNNFYTYEEVSRHSSILDCWIIIDGDVYDITKFINKHPGGKKTLLASAGKNASDKFFFEHGKKTLFLMKLYKIGSIKI